ncbi:AMP-binding protein [Oricola cellulosilytica]|uniref:Long-chain fatty acid--CoA ligase n=1 Tax=Oricola cellulosilytica TaxID=1429082 RepID=A0A4R0PEU6_9HYPH|nr:AMP-binding protein [Oricola cellulosilytica]TCD14905.1 long-chain fatty acid--CoA ligase [Oricola cellulosilytica]
MTRSEISRDNKGLKTFPRILAHNARHFGSETALREKTFGIWVSQTWSDYNANVRRIALGLTALGIRKGDIIGLIGDNRPDWVAAEIAAHACGALSLGLYRDLMEAELAYLVNYSEARFIFAEDEEQVDKFLLLGDGISSVERIIFEDPRGMRKYDDPRLMSLEDLRAKGDELLAADAGSYDRMVEETDGEAPAILCTTSGTTSHPKLAVLSARSIIDHSHDYLSADPKGPDDEYVSVLQLPWIMEQIYVFGQALISRMKVNFVEDQETMMADMREIGPTFILLAPRVWEQIAADVRARIMDSSWLKQKLYDFFMNMGLGAFEKGRTSRAAQLFLYNALKDRIGLTNVRSAATGGAALGPDTFKFFLAMGVPLRQLYGQTELLGAYTIHTPDDVDFDTVGVPFTGDIKVRIEAPDAEGIGEIVTAHGNMFMGYYKNEAATGADLRDGWMYTGDAGYYNDKGHLVVIDRIADLAEMTGNRRYSPQFIENKLKFSPFIAEAVILGDKRDYLAAMICIRYSIVSKWAEKNRISFTTYTDLSSRREVYDLVHREIEAINETLPEAQRLRKFVLLYKELDPDDGELTRTRKVRRAVVAEKYGDIIDTIYSGQEDIAIDTMISFQDGTQQRIRTTIKVRNVGAEIETPALKAAE